MNQCTVCGRPCIGVPSGCHPPEITSIEHKLAGNDVLLPRRRDSEIVDDTIQFTPLYLVVEDLISENIRIDKFRDESPYFIDEFEWVADMHRKVLRDGSISENHIIETCNRRTWKKAGYRDPYAVVAHLVYLGQFYLYPTVETLGISRYLRKKFMNEIDKNINPTDSEYLVRRRIDRRKVLSTTKKFREDYDLSFDIYRSDSKQYEKSKVINGSPVVADHCDHNILVNMLRKEMSRLPSVDWTTAPHIIYSRNAEMSLYTNNRYPQKHPTICYDSAGFSSTDDGSELEYIGVVIDREETPAEMFDQLDQVLRTGATGIFVLPTTRSIYRFLSYLHSEGITRKYVYADFEDYQAIPNVSTLHDKIINKSSLLNSIAFYPRRKFIDEGLSNIFELL